MTKKQGIKYNPPSESFWTLPDVNHRGEIATYRLFEKLTPAMNLEQTSEHYTKEKQKGNPYPANSQLISSIWNSAYDFKKQNPKRI